MKKILAALGAALIATASMAEEETTERPPNIIIVLADDLGYGDPQCYNPDSKIPTPGMNRMAGEGMRFTQAYSASGVCTPSRYTLLTGRYSWRGTLKKGVLWGYSPSLIEPGRATIASILKEAGYHTACVGKWHLGLGTEEKTDYTMPLLPGPLDFGFDHFFGIPASLDMDPYLYIEDDRAVAPLTGETEGNDPRGPGFWRPGAASEGFRHEEVMPKLQERALQYIRARARSRDLRPFFLYYPLPAPHTPCLPTKEFAGKTNVGAYGDFTVQVDAALGEIIDTLQAEGISDNTLLIFSSDNGGHEGVVPKESGHDSNGPLRGQKADCWEGGIRVPFLARWPRAIPAGSVNSAVAGQVDLFATIAALIGRSAKEQEGEDSLSLLPSLKGGGLDDTRRKGLIGHSSQGYFALRQGDWKYIEGVGGGGFGWNPRDAEPKPGEPAGQLYNLAEDPAESNNLYATQPERVAAMQALLNDIRDSGRSVTAR